MFAADLPSWWCLAQRAAGFKALSLGVLAELCHCILLHQFLPGKAPPALWVVLLSPQLLEGGSHRSIVEEHHNRDPRGGPPMGYCMSSSHSSWE